MTDDTNILHDPEFRQLLKARSRWRWGLSGGLVGSYLVYVLAGIYVPDVYARPFAGSSVPWGVVLGYLLIGLSIGLSMLYVSVVKRLKGFHEHSRGLAR
jgi:uncharacterized membrane protein (DUF485 family)